MRKLPFLKSNILSFIFCLFSLEYQVQVKIKITLNCYDLFFQFQVYILNQSLTEIGFQKYINTNHLSIHSFNKSTEGLLYADIVLGEQDTIFALSGIKRSKKVLTKKAIRCATCSKGAEEEPLSQG